MDEEIPIYSLFKKKAVVFGVTVAILLQIFTLPVIASENQYVVKKGDNLWVIAKRFDTTINDLKIANNLNSDIIYPQQVLKLPTKHLPAANSSTYTVKRGDNLWIIAKKYGTTISALQKTNGIAGSLIHPGQRLVIPQRAVPVTSRGGTRYDRNDLYWLARAISAEAKGEPLLGQIAVGAVILNRVKYPHFPNSIKDVVFQRVNGVYQFSPVQNGSIYNQPTKTAYEAAERALAGEDPTNGALYFYNPHITASNNWIRTRPVARVVNNHVFAL